MPQLIPGPWFAILVYTWVIFLTVVIPKTLAFTYPNEPMTQTTITPKTEPWVWPWI